MSFILSFDVSIKGAQLVAAKGSQVPELQLLLQQPDLPSTYSNFSIYIVNVESHKVMC